MTTDTYRPARGRFAPRGAIEDATAPSIAVIDLAAEEGLARVDERLSPRLVLAAALDGLPEHEREALELRVVSELPYDEVAERLAIRPAAARLRVSRALRRLAQVSTREDEA